MIQQVNEKRTRLQKYTAGVLPLVIIGGWLYPPLGFSLLLCMVGAVGVALYRGRQWCDWMCPRGSFYDLFLNRMSRKLPIPLFFRSNWFRTSILTLLMASLGAQIYFAWGDSAGVGMAFVIVLSVTTTIGIVLGAVFKPRAWCQICPMGTIGSWMAKGKKPLYVSDHCRDCKACAKACPMQLKPYESQAGVMGDSDCIKCSSCIAACPVQALGFEEQPKKAA